jgi:ATP-binding cassette subfamily B protein
MTLFLGIGALLVLWQGSREVIQGRITIGGLVAFNAYLVMLAWPMIAFGWVTNMIQRGLASWKRMREVMDQQPSILDPGSDAVASDGVGRTRRSGAGHQTAREEDDEEPGSRSRRTTTITGRIEFRHVTFAYNGRRVLDGISVVIEPGQTVALVGATGSGKSTLISLVPRLHDPEPGTVFIDGTDVREIPFAVLRGAIGFVPQEPFLFSDTLADNVAFSPVIASLAGEERDRAVRDAAAVSRLDKDVADFPQAYATTVGERGITLSGGQKQRTALARAVALDPRILILDDALSAVDTYTEEEILSRLRGVMKQRTSIIVSHRISTVREADQILVLERGRIAERGTHDSLVSAGGLYAELYRQQLLEEELASQQ